MQLRRRKNFDSVASCELRLETRNPFERVKNSSSRKIKRKINFNNNDWRWPEQPSLSVSLAIVYGVGAMLSGARKDG